MPRERRASIPNAALVPKDPTNMQSQLDGGRHRGPSDETPLFGGGVSPGNRPDNGDIFSLPSIPTPDQSQPQATSADLDREQSANSENPLAHRRDHEPEHLLPFSPQTHTHTLPTATRDTTSQHDSVRDNHSLDVQFDQNIRTTDSREQEYAIVAENAPHNPPEASHGQRPPPSFTTTHNNPRFEAKDINDVPSMRTEQDPSDDSSAQSNPAASMIRRAQQEEISPSYPPLPASDVSADINPSFGAPGDFEQQTDDGHLTVLVPKTEFDQDEAHMTPKSPIPPAHASAPRKQISKQQQSRRNHPHAEVCKMDDGDDTKNRFDETQERNAAQAAEIAPNRKPIQSARARSGSSPQRVASEFDDFENSRGRVEPPPFLPPAEFQSTPRTSKKQRSRQPKFRSSATGTIQGTNQGKSEPQRLDLQAPAAETLPEVFDVKQERDVARAAEIAPHRPPTQPTIVRSKGSSLEQGQKVEPSADYHPSIRFQDSQRAPDGRLPPTEDQRSPLSTRESLNYQPGGHYNEDVSKESSQVQASTPFHQSLSGQVSRFQDHVDGHSTGQTSRAIQPDVGGNNKTVAEINQEDTVSSLGMHRAHPIVGDVTTSRFRQDQSHSRSNSHNSNLDDVHRRSSYRYSDLMESLGAEEQNNLSRTIQSNSIVPSLESREKRRTTKDVISEKRSVGAPQTRQELLEALKRKGVDRWVANIDAKSDEQLERLLATISPL